MSAFPKQDRDRLEDVSVVVLSYNRKEELLTNLPILCRQGSQTGFELIVVDNASEDGSREILENLEQKYSNVRIIYNKKNLGVAAGRNTGHQHANGKYVLFLDDDTHLAIDDIYRLCLIMDERPDIGVISPKICHAKSGRLQNDHGDLECEVGNFHGACHLVRQKALREVGDIDPLCSFGGEELDYSIRMRAHGYGVLYTPSIKVKHNNYVRHGAEDMWRRSMCVYNFARVHFKHFPMNTAAIFAFRCLLSHMASGVREHGYRFAFSLPKKVIMGALDGKKQYQAIPKETKLYYADHTTLPDFGNVPLFRKLLNLGSRNLK